MFIHTHSHSHIIHISMRGQSMHIKTKTKTIPIKWWDCWKFEILTKDNYTHPDRVRNKWHAFVFQTTFTLTKARTLTPSKEKQQWIAQYICMYEKKIHLYCTHTHTRTRYMDRSNYAFFFLLCYCFIAQCWLLSIFFLFCLARAGLLRKSRFQLKCKKNRQRCLLRQWMTDYEYYEMKKKKKKEEKRPQMIEIVCTPCVTVDACMCVRVCVYMCVYV